MDGPRTERRSKVLTPADMNALRGELRLLFEEHKCQFADAEIQTVKDFITIYKETRSVVLKTLIGCLFLGILILFVLGVQHNLINVPSSNKG